MRDHQGASWSASRVALLSSVCLWIALSAACRSDETTGRDADEIALPVVPAAPADEMAAGAVVKVTRDGRIIFDGKGRSVNELLAAVARHGSSGPFELGAHRDALWMHVQWVMAALGESGHKAHSVGPRAPPSACRVKMVPWLMGSFAR